MQRPTRRTLLQGMGALGCSVAAHPLVTPISFASAPGESRLVVLILRGAMDGLDVLQPVGDRHYARARQKLRSPSHALTDFYALNEALDPLRPLWDRGELGFAQAVATPYRDKRSHFDGQDLLEAGTADDVAIQSQRDGWLNRFLQTLPHVTGETAYAVGSSDMKILTGKAPSASWSPNTKLPLSDASRRLLERIYMDDPLFHQAATEAIDLANSVAGSQGKQKSKGPSLSAADRALAEFTADRLNRETRIASFSINGWDTHAGQVYPLKIALTRLSHTILTLRDHLGSNWAQTTVLAMTEFGRTVRENGNQGTDHGTGGMMIMAGGAVRGRQIYGDWPGLSEADLYARRDLMPTADVRAYAAWALADLYGTTRDDLERRVFPGLDIGDNPGFIL